MFRGFELTSNESDVNLIPRRADLYSAGYDFVSPIDAVIPAGETVFIKTNVKAYMLGNEVLMIYPRSSVGIKHNVILANTTGVIDSSYYNNPSNEGNIILALKNMSTEDYKIRKYDRIAQGVFFKYLTSGDNPTGKRTGGIGSSGK